MVATSLGLPLEIYDLATKVTVDRRCCFAGQPGPGAVPGDHQAAVRRARRQAAPTRPGCAASRSWRPPSRRPPPTAARRPRPARTRPAQPGRARASPDEAPETAQDASAPHRSPAQPPWPTASPALLGGQPGRPERACRRPGHPLIGGAPRPEPSLPRRAGQGPSRRSACRRRCRGRARRTATCPASSSSRDSPGQPAQPLAQLGDGDRRDLLAGPGQAPAVALARFAEPRAVRAPAGGQVVDALAGRGGRWRRSAASSRRPP